MRGPPPRRLAAKARFGARRVAVSVDWQPPPSVSDRAYPAPLPSTVAKSFLMSNRSSAIPPISPPSTTLKTIPSDGDGRPLRLRAAAHRDEFVTTQSILHRLGVICELDVPLAAKSPLTFRVAPKRLLRPIVALNAAPETGPLRRVFREPRLENTSAFTNSSEYRLFAFKKLIYAPLYFCMCTLTL